MPTTINSLPTLAFGCCWSAILLAPASLKAHDFLELPDYPVIERETNLIGETVTASEGAYGQSDLEYRPILRTAEVLEVVPGLIVTQHSGTGKANQYFLRGFNLDHGTDFATFIDGMPVNMVTHGHGQGYSDFNFLIPELIETVSYTKGPYHAALGDFSSAGSAHIRTFDWLEQGFAMLTLGENHFYRAVVADSYDLNQRETLLGAIESQFYDGPWDNEEDLKQYKGVGKYTRQLKDGSISFAVYGYDAEWDSADQIPKRAVQQGIISDLGSIDEDVCGETSRYSFSTDFNKDSGTGLTTSNAYAVYYDMNLWSNFTYFLKDDINGDEFEQADERIISGFNLTHTIPYAELFDRYTRHTLGLQMRYDSIEVGLYDTAGRKRLNTVRKDDINQFSAGLFYENEIQWSERLKSIVGLRTDFYYFDVESDLSANSGTETTHLLVLKSAWSTTQTTS